MKPEEFIKDAFTCMFLYKNVDNSSAGKKVKNMTERIWRIQQLWRMKRGKEKPVFIEEIVDINISIYPNLYSFSIEHSTSFISFFEDYICTLY